MHVNLKIDAGQKERQKKKDDVKFELGGYFVEIKKQGHRIAGHIKHNNQQVLTKGIRKQGKLAGREERKRKTT